MQINKSRAQTRLYSGTDLEKVHVFWDYANLASIDQRADLRQGQFREEFIQSAQLHLDYLKEMNQPGEIKSRMDYIRWAFPAVINDPRLHEVY